MRWQHARPPREARRPAQLPAVAPLRLAGLQQLPQPLLLQTSRGAAPEDLCSLRELRVVHSYWVCLREVVHVGISRVPGRILANSGRVLELRRGAGREPLDRIPHAGRHPRLSPEACRVGPPRPRPPFDRPPGPQEPLWRQRGEQGTLLVRERGLRLPPCLRGGGQPQFAGGERRRGPCVADVAQGLPQERELVAVRVFAGRGGCVA
mmetsp:Transcript_2852/g.6639  ORF Transcript_2852/g.6639 Transcript_2852/m.6639 type:complete len:207 (+) Transcript_2852:2072-2692(+)